MTFNPVCSSSPEADLSVPCQVMQMMQESVVASRPGDRPGTFHTCIRVWKCGEQQEYHLREPGDGAR
jgi:hypothetical protein